jgi:hypothetical protein
MLNPTWWLDSQIEKLLLKEIPLGTSRDEAVEIINSNNLRIQTRRSNSITIILGPSYKPLSRVEADLTFDDDGYLVAVYIIRLTIGI